MSYSDEDTVEIVPIPSQLEPVVAQSFDEPGISVAALTNRGKRRETNEDQFAVVRRTRSGKVLASSLSSDRISGGRQHAWLLAVADGLGGHVSGEVASATALSTILKFANSLNSWVMGPTDGLHEDLKERVALYAEAIQSELQEQAKSDPRLAGMATTVTTAYLFQRSALIANLGDSRSYLVRSGEIHQITQDHTLGRDLQEKGLSKEAVRPYRNVLTRCFNTGGDKVELDLFYLDLQQGDQILLCTDGLTDMVPDEDILEHITSGESTHDTCEALAEKALDKGGRDNITIVLAQVQ
jgi:protein phosphatase